MTNTVSTHSENRWVKLDVFCERSGILCVVLATGIRMAA